MPTWMTALIAAAAIAAIYFFCIRPMWRGNGRCATADRGERQEAELSKQVAELREELRILRAGDELDAIRASGRGEQPPATAS